MASESITYLSTPFFTRLHQVDTTAFDDDCKIINAYLYVAMVAHSTSRETLHEGVKTVLKQQFTTLTKGGR